MKYMDNKNKIDNMSNLEEAIPYIPLVEMSEEERKEMLEKTLELVRKVFKEIEEKGRLV
jgi:hypothetical protein